MIDILGKWGREKARILFFLAEILANFLKDSDLVVGNLEGPITNNSSISIKSEVGTSTNFVFTFPLTTAKLLAKNNIKLVNLGNNHIVNFGQEGIASTKKYLTEVGVSYFGQPREALAKWGNISFISYNEFGGDLSEKISEKIKEEKNNGQIVFVYSHWGDEYSEVSGANKKYGQSFL